MDCTKSPEAEGGAPTASRPLRTSSSYCPLQANGWPLPISNGPPSLPPLPRVDNNNGPSPACVMGRQVRWGGLGAGWGLSGYTGAPPTEQDPGVSCPSCCLVGLALLLNVRTWWQVSDSVLHSQRKRLHGAANNLAKLKSEGFMKVRT